MDQILINKPLANSLIEPLTKPLIEPPSFSACINEAKATLTRIATEFKPSVFASSLAVEDMVLTDLILKNKLPINIFSINTGRLPAETLTLMEQVRQTYGYQLIVYHPDTTSVINYIETNGYDGFYESTESRKACCYVRKAEPLKRALTGSQAWITGQRRDQSVTRSGLAVQEQDLAHGIAKFNPLADWSLDDVWYYIQLHHVPYNALHDAGYPSIGCAPCARAVQPGEDIRAGRWWWESPENKECGLHMVNGKLIRAKVS